MAKIEGKAIDNTEVMKVVDTYLAYLATQSKLYINHDYSSLGPLAIYDIYTITEDPEIIKQGYDNNKHYENLARLAGISKDDMPYFNSLIINEYNKLFNK